MSSILAQIPRLLRRAALFGFTSLALLAMAGTAGTTEPREGGAEESVHAATEYASGWTKYLLGGADDDASDVALPARDAFALALHAVHTVGFWPHYTNALKAQARALPAARGPPLLG
ncbi:MAG: hypothetical protein IBJ03_06065 [Gemmatimonadaceae bacterium]|nr:hypothetical protein [Gemmatimonadaceae bacterium]